MRGYLVASLPEASPIGRGIRTLDTVVRAPNKGSTATQPFVGEVTDPASVRRPGGDPSPELSASGELACFVDPLHRRGAHAGI
jgi:hypothetical protein